MSRVPDEPVSAVAARTVPELPAAQAAASAAATPVAIREE
jgi:hypothetical protein